MLTSDLTLSWQRGQRIGPRYLNVEDATYLQAAEELISLVQGHLGQRRAELDQALNEYVGVGTDYKILRGLIKLLLDRCLFETSCPKDPVEIRQALFLKARQHHPVIESTGLRQQVIVETAQELGCRPEAVIEGLYADLPEKQKLVGFAQLSARQLLEEYNLAQAQALLYRCVEMRLWVEPQQPAGYRQLFEAIKYYRLIHSIKGNSTKGYEIILTGPVSMFHRSQRYGVQMAVFLPALLECEGWRMRAEIETKRGRRFFELSSNQRQLRLLHSIKMASDDSLVERLLASWMKLSSAWSLEPCREVIDLGESAFVPDLVASHPKGEKVYLELLGFWTPRYLSQRLKEFEQSGFEDYLLVASEELRGSRERAGKLPSKVVIYKAAPDARAIQAALETKLN